MGRKVKRGKLTNEEYANATTPAATSAMNMMRMMEKNCRMGQGEGFKYFII